ncbi:MAG: cytochrome c3 family protein [Candidatus Kapaibacterium sp.]
MVIAAFSEAYIYYGSNIGYQPKQPIEFSHKTHAGKFGIKCLFCHYSAETSEHAVIPTTYECMRCHIALLVDDPRLRPLNYSYDNDLPIEWAKVNKLPDYVRFRHDVHLRAEIDCASCHGIVDSLDAARQDRSLSMSWCLDCHRQPGVNAVNARNISGIQTRDWYGFDYWIVSYPKTRPQYGLMSDSLAGDVPNVPFELPFGPSTAVEQCSGCHY